MADTPVSETAVAVEAAPGEYDFDDDGFGTPFDPTPVKLNEPAPEPAPATETPAVPEAAVPAAPAAPAVPAPQLPAPVELTPQQVARAQAVGLSPESLSAFGPNAEMAIVSHENALLKSVLLQQQQRPAAPVAPAPPVQPELLNVEHLKSQYKAEGYEENMIDVFARDAERHNQHLSKQYELDKKLFDMQAKEAERDKWSSTAYDRIQQIAAQQQQQQARHTEELIHRDYDSWKTAASPELKKLLEQPGADGRIFQNANIIFTGQFHNGIPLAPNPEVFELAAQMAFGKELKGIVREELRAEVKEHQGRALARPTGGGKPQRQGSADERAYGVAEEWYRKHGIGTLQPVHSSQDL